MVSYRQHDMAFGAEGFRSTLARGGRETERNRAVTPPLFRLLLATSRKQGLLCWCNELSWWAGEFLQHLSCFAPWLGHVLSFKRSMRKTLQNTVIMDNIWNFLVSSRDRQLIFMHLRVQQKPVTSRVQSQQHYQQPPSIPSHTLPPPLSDSQQKVVLRELLTANVLSFYHLWYFCLSVRGQ